MKKSYERDGLYYSPFSDELIQWEHRVQTPEGHVESYTYGIAWCGSFYYDDRVIGTPIALDEFEDRVLHRGFAFIGEV